MASPQYKMQICRRALGRQKLPKVTWCHLSSRTIFICSSACQTGSYLRVLQSYPGIAKDIMCSQYVSLPFFALVGCCSVQGFCQTLLLQRTSTSIVSLSYAFCIFLRCFPTCSNPVSPTDPHKPYKLRCNKCCKLTLDTLSWRLSLLISGIHRHPKTQRDILPCLAVPNVEQRFQRRLHVFDGSDLRSAAVPLFWCSIDVNPEHQIL